MFENGMLPRNRAMLQIGEANWYDLDPMSLVDDIKKFVSEADGRDALIKRLTEVVEERGKFFFFDIAKVFYQIFFAPSEMQAVDFEGTPAAHRFDLNEPIALARRFDVVINHGTAEHIFNVAQVFRTVHDYTVPGGMMIHEGPFTGWIDHGFYSLHPTLYYDLAEYNQYGVLGMFIQDLTARSILQIRSRDEVHELAKAKQIPENTMLFVVLKKGDDDRPFRVPIQGYYRQSLSAAGMAAWTDMR